MRLLIAFLALLTISTPATARDLYILAGQSNMSGRGQISQLPAFPNASRITIFGNDWQWRAGAEPVDDASGQQLSVGVDANAAASPGMAFADRMVTLTGNDVGLIPCARGGTSISLWEPNYSWISLYGACLEAARRAGASGTIRGVIFWQGESDAVSEAQARRWGAGFTAFVRAIRSDLQSPDLPIVFAQLGPDPVTRWAEFPGWDQMQLEQWTMRGPHMAMITTQDLPSADELHISTPGLVTAGQRFADAMAALLAP